MVFYSRRLQKPVDIYGETGLGKSDKVRKKISNTGLRGQREIFTSWCLELVTERGRGSIKIRKSPEWVRLKFGMRCRTGSKRNFSHSYQIFPPRFHKDIVRSHWNPKFVLVLWHSTSACRTFKYSDFTVPDSAIHTTWNILLKMSFLFFIFD